MLCKTRFAGFLVPTLSRQTSKSFHYAAALSTSSQVCCGCVGVWRVSVCEMQVSRKIEHESDQEKQSCLAIPQSGHNSADSNNGISASPQVTGLAMVQGSIAVSMMTVLMLGLFMLHSSRWFDESHTSKWNGLLSGKQGL